MRVVCSIYCVYYVHILCFRACYMYCLSYHLCIIATIILDAKKSKGVPVHRIKAYEVDEVEILLFLTLVVIDVVSSQLHTFAALFREKGLGVLQRK